MRIDEQFLDVQPVGLIIDSGRIDFEPPFVAKPMVLAESLRKKTLGLADVEVSG